MTRTGGTPPDPALRALGAALTQLYVQAGAPSKRGIAWALKDEPGDPRPPSHTTVGDVLRCEKLPRWRYVELIVRHLGALRVRPAVEIERDVIRVRELWSNARTTGAPARTPPHAEPLGSLAGGLQSLYTPADLEFNCVLPLALDDQWMPRGLLQRMAAGRLSAAAAERERRRLVRSEFVRSLITAKQVVLNRAFLFRNDAISEVYTESRDALVELLEQEAVLVFLIDERDPLDSPYAKHPDAHSTARAWAEIARRTQVGCVRFSWDNAENEEHATAWHRDFETRVRQAVQINCERLVTDAGAADGDAGVLRVQLNKVSRRSLPKRPIPITRTRFYREFLVRSAEDIERRVYDFAKPNMIPLKWLIDLAYNSNLATRLGVALGGPVDSVHRSVVHASNHQSLGGGLDPAPLRTAVLETIQDALFRRAYDAGALSVFDGIPLARVVEIRAGKPWLRYTAAVDGLLAEPALLSHPERGLRQVLQNYDELIESIGSVR